MARQATRPRSKQSSTHVSQRFRPAREARVKSNRLFVQLNASGYGSGAATVYLVIRA